MSHVQKGVSEANDQSRRATHVSVERAVLFHLIELAARAAKTMDDVAVVDYAAIVAATAERRTA
jgi:hypothetical protein